MWKFLSNWAWDSERSENYKSSLIFLSFNNDDTGEEMLFSTDDDKYDNKRHEHYYTLTARWHITFSSIITNLTMSTKSVCATIMALPNIMEIVLQLSVFILFQPLRLFMPTERLTLAAAVVVAAAVEEEAPIVTPKQ